MPPKKKTPASAAANKEAPAPRASSRIKAQAGAATVGTVETTAASKAKLAAAKKAAPAKKPPATAKKASPAKKKAVAQSEAIELLDGDDDEAVEVEQGKRKRGAGAAATGGKTKKEKFEAEVPVPTKAVAAKRGRPARKKVDEEVYGAKEEVEKAKGNVVKPKVEKDPFEAYWDKYEAFEDAQPQGIVDLGRWFTDLGISDEGPTAFLLLWKCQAEHAMMVRKEGFMRFVKEHKITSTDKLCKTLPALLTSVSPNTPTSDFLELYRWTFDHFRDPSSMKRSIDLDTACLLFNAFLYPKKYENPFWKPEDGKGEEKHVQAFCEYLQSLEEGKRKEVTRDEFMCVRRFNLEVGKDFEGWCEEESTWPTRLDAFVGWEMERKGRRE